MWCRTEEMGVGNVPNVQGGYVAWRASSIIRAAFIHDYAHVRQVGSRPDK